MIWLMIGYMFLFIERPFEVWPWLGDFRIELVYMLMTGVFWIFHSRKRATFNSLNLAYCAFALVVLLACATSPWSDKCLTFYFDIYWKFLVFYLMLVTVINDEEDLRRILIGFVSVLAIYMLHSLREYLCGRYVVRMGISRLSGIDSTNDPNSFAGTIMLGLVFVPTLWRAYPGLTARRLVVGFAALSLICIVLTGSRGAFVALIVWACIAIAQSRHRFQLGFALLAVSPLLWMLMPAEMQTRFETIIWPEVGPKNAEISAHGRTEGFLIGLQLWQNNPVLGIGPGAWLVATGRSILAHNLYGELVGETGTLGLFAFLGILGAYLFNIRAIREKCPHASGKPPDFLYDMTTAIGVAVVLLLFSGTYSHNLFRYQWLWYAGFLVAVRKCAELRMSKAVLELSVLHDESAGDEPGSASSFAFPFEMQPHREYA
jgi:O-antigen ligase